VGAKEAEEAGEEDSTYRTNTAYDYDADDDDDDDDIRTAYTVRGVPAHTTALLLVSSCPVTSELSLILDCRC